MLINRLRSWANSLRNKTYALYLTSKDPRIPFHTKIIIGLVLAYALSPIDLIPDFIPIIGYLDDLLLLPFGIWLAIRLIPPEIWKEHQDNAAKRLTELPKNRWAGVAVITIWCLIALGVGFYITQ